jgi:hypothetical protein
MADFNPQVRRNQRAYMVNNRTTVSDEQFIEFDVACRRGDDALAARLVAEARAREDERLRA